MYVILVNNEIVYGATDLNRFTHEAQRKYAGVANCRFDIVKPTETKHVPVQ